MSNVSYPPGKKKDKYGGPNIIPNEGTFVTSPVKGNGLKIDFYNGGYEADTYNLLNFNFSQLKIIS